MAVAQGPLLAALLLVASSGLHCFPLSLACPERCTCPRAALSNCSSSGLSSIPRRIQGSVAELDLSHNRLRSVTLERQYRELRTLRLGNNSIAHLSLCTARRLGGRAARGGHVEEGRCVSGAPTLQLLSAERNQLEQLPEGLGSIESLQVLDLSYNRITSLRPGELSHLWQLRELHLQHNLITTLHPQMFQDLSQLKVLDLSFNMLTSLHPLMYVSLRSIGASVLLAGNQWQCDCRMRSLRRRMAYDSSRDVRSWSVECASPSIVAGRDLLRLREDELNCLGTENKLATHQDVTVYSGSEILLSCSSQGSTWWTPGGQTTESESQAGLLVSDVTEKDTGLYVCVSEEPKVVSVFNLQISEVGGARRKTRSVSGTDEQIAQQGTLNRNAQQGTRAAAQCDLALAVCLSVFITFLVAFILGVLARPCIDHLWKKITNKRRSSGANAVRSAEPKQYDNEAYSNAEEIEYADSQRERRVTFNTVEYTDRNNVAYYDTVVQESHQTNSTAVVESEARRPQPFPRAAGNEHSSSDENPDSTYETIPKRTQMKKRGSLSSSSVSSSDEVFTENQRVPKPPPRAKNSVQQRSDLSQERNSVVPQISIEASEVPGFSSKPVADWSPHEKKLNMTDSDLWQENGEPFDYSDSVPSTSPRSAGHGGSFNHPKQIAVPTLDKQRRDMTSSSSLSSDQEGGYDVKLTHNKTKQRRKVRPKHSTPSHSSDSDGEKYPVNPETMKKVQTMPRTKSHPSIKAETSSSSDSEGVWPTVDLENIPPIKRRLDMKVHSPSSDSSSSSDSEDGTENRVKKQTHVDSYTASPGKVSPTSRGGPQTQWPVIDLEQSIGIKRRLDIKPASPSSDSSSSSDSEDETIHPVRKQEHMKQPVLVPQHTTSIKRGQDIKASLSNPSSSSSSDSEDETTKWPALDLEHTTSVKRRLDIKVKSPSDSSSSSDSEDEKTYITSLPSQLTQTVIKTPPVKQPVLVPQPQASIKKRQAPSPPSGSSSSSDSEDETTKWPALDLEHTSSVKRRLDIKVKSPSDSSSSSDSEDEKAYMTSLPSQLTQTVINTPPMRQPVLVPELSVKRGQDIKASSPPSGSSSSSDSEDETTKWPVLDLEHTSSVKRRLDIKVKSPSSGSSSSSDSEDEKTYMTSLPSQLTQTVIKTPPMKQPVLVPHHTSSIKRGQAPSPPSGSSSSSDSEDETTKWPALDLEHTTSVKRRLDIKVKSPSDSSSSSDSEDEKAYMTSLPSQLTQTVINTPPMKQPVLVPQHTTSIKRGQDIKASLSHPSSSSSSDSEDETTKWPALDLEHTTNVKRRLDIKVKSPSSDSSSSSDSEDETINPVRKQEQMKQPVLVPQHQASIKKRQAPSPPSGSSSSSDSEDETTKWPALDLEHTTNVKRRLDIKVKSPSDSSSSSDSEDETITPVRKQEQMKQPVLGPQHTTSIKRGQDIKASPSHPSSSSSSDSEDETTKWPALDLEHTTSVKRHLDIKVKSPSDSSSSSDSEDEKTYMTSLPSQVTQTVIKTPPMKEPVLVPQHTTSIKKRQAPSPPSDSSSSSDSEDEKTSQKPGRVETVGFPPTSHHPNVKWPLLDLWRLPRIKRRLDFKAPSPSSGSSSSSDSEDEKMHMTSLPSQLTQTVIKSPPLKQPVLVPQHTTSIKRVQDVKTSSSHSDSSSSSDSEVETTGHIKRPGEVEVVGPPILGSQLESSNHDTQWPVLDLEHTTSVKRRLDIKVASTDSDSSSSSDSEEETTNYVKKQTHSELHAARPSVKISKPVSGDLQTEWPVVNLEGNIATKRRLDIKVASSDSDSSSSSDSEDEETSHMKVDFAKLPYTKSPSSDMKWPLLDLWRLPRIKRRLDFKAPSPSSGSSSSSDSEDEKMYMTSLPSQLTQTVLIPQHTASIKKGQDIKASLSHSDSSSSSDSEVETTGHKNSPSKVDIVGPPLQGSRPGSHSPDTKWPTLDLQHTPSVKRRLDIKVEAPNSDSSSSSDSEDEKTSHQSGQTESHQPDMKWPDLRHTPRIKRRLDIKAPSAPSSSSSSSDSEEEKTYMVNPPTQLTQTMTNPQSKQSVLVPQHTASIKRGQDIKASFSHSDSSSSSDSEVESTGHKKRPSKVDIVGSPLQGSRPGIHSPDTKRPTMHLEHTPSVKRRLDIKAPSAPSSSSSSSDSEDEANQKKHMQGHIHLTKHPVQTATQTQRPVLDLNYTPQDTNVDDLLSFTATEEPDQNVRWSQLSPSSAHPVYIHQDVRKKSQSESSSSSSWSEGETKETKMPETFSSIPLINRRLNIRAATPQLDPVLINHHQPESHSSTSESEDENQVKTGSGKSATGSAFIWSPKSPFTPTPYSPKKDPNIKLEKYTVIPDDMIDKTASDNLNATSNVTPELASRWATMSLGVSRFRKNLKIASQITDSPNQPLSPEPSSPRSAMWNYKQTRRNTKEFEKAQATPPLQKPDSSSSSDDEETSTDYTWRERSQKTVVAPQHVMEVAHIKLGGNEEVDGTVRMSQDIRAPLRRGEYLNVSAPRQSSSSSSSSESENETTGNQNRLASDLSAMADDSIIAYKRLIFNSVSPPSTPSTLDYTIQRRTVAEPAPVSPEPHYSWSGSKTSFSPDPPQMRSEDSVNKRLEQPRETIGLPPSMRWTGTKAKADGAPARTYSSPGVNSVDYTINKAVENFTNLAYRTNEMATPEAKGDRRGLSALKAMSSERRRWDAEDGHSKRQASPLSPYHDSQVGTLINLGSEEDIKPWSTQQQQFHLPSASIATDLSYDIPLYRRHDAGGIQPPQGSSPLVPTTASADEAGELTWRSPQGRWERGVENTRSSLPQGRDTDQSKLSSEYLPLYFNSQNISHV